MQADCFRISVVKNGHFAFPEVRPLPKPNPPPPDLDSMDSRISNTEVLHLIKKKKISAIKMATRKNLLGLTGHCFYCAGEASVSLTLPLAILFFFLTVSYSTDTFVSVHSVHVRTAWIPHHFPLLQ